MLFNSLSLFQGDDYESETFHNPWAPSAPPELGESQLDNTHLGEINQRYSLGEVNDLSAVPKYYCIISESCIVAASR